MKIIYYIFLVTFLLFKNIEAIIPQCSDCKVYAISKDDISWGFENDNFCKLSPSCLKNSETDSNSIKSTNSTNSTETSTHEKDASGNPICHDCVVTGTGGDGSLWGWEDEKSCIVDQMKCKGKVEEFKASTNSTNSTADSTHKKDASGNLICNDCVVTSTGGDGSYWGWEDNDSCKIDNIKCNLSPPKSDQKPLERGPDGILICSTCEYTRVDPDTTTWNKENGEDCRVIGSRCGINTTPHPWCGGCVVTGTGNDGALYGWENNSSCLINEVTCGIVDTHGEYGEVSSSIPSIQKKSFLYCAIVSIINLFLSLFF